MTQKEWEEFIKKECIKDIENRADRALRNLEKATEESMEDYYSFPEGDYYMRTGAFGKAYTTFKQQDTKDPHHITFTVGVAFQSAPDYKHHGISIEDIYTLNLSGEHGGNGNNGDVIERVRKAADFIAADQ